MKNLKPVLLNVLRDKTANNIIVGVLIAFGLGTLVSIATSTFYGSGGPGWSQWWGMMWRQLLGFLVTLVVAELISRMAKR